MHGWPELDCHVLGWASMSDDSTAQILRLEDGRGLGYAEWGDQAGTPVFHFHGSSSSRLERPADLGLPDRVRLVTVDRPGHGLSDFQTERRLLDWPNDVTALADHLGIESFAVSGWSFGGPYAMACARSIPERLTGVAVVSSFAPYDRPGSTTDMARVAKVSLGMARRAPWWMTRRFMAVQGRALTDRPEETAKRMLSSLPDADRRILEEPAVTDVLVPAMTEAYRNGADGPAWDGRMMVRPWGFDLSEISMPIDIWHGDADVNNPMQSAAYLRDTIPESRANFLDGEGHFFIFKYWRKIIEQLART